MKCNIIGAGRLGKNIALALSNAQLISSLAICNRSVLSSQKASLALHGAQVVDKIKHLPQADITWICCNDDAIQEIINLLAQYEILKPGNLVIHCSGVLSSILLSPLKNLGCSVASFHPLKAFKTNYLEAHAFKQVHCIFEGDEEACLWLRASFTSLGAQLIEIKPEAKSLYHAAACMASNYLITLAACSEELLIQAGIDLPQRRQMTVDLMQGNLNNLLQTKCLEESLTGPISRGDIRTLKLHLDSIKNPETKHLYQSAALRTLSLTQLSTEQKQQIKELCD